MLPPSVVAVLLALCCSALWAVANIYVRRAGIAVGNLRAMFWAQLVGSAVMIPIALALDGWPGAPNWRDLAIAGAGSALGYYGMVVAFRTGALSAVVPIVTAWSVPAAIAGVVWSSDDPTPLQWIGGAMILVGAVGNGALATREDPGEHTPTTWSTLAWAAGSAIGFGIMAAGTARMRPVLGTVGVIPAVWVAQWVLLSPLVLRRDVHALPNREAWPSVLGMALFEATGFVSFTLASKLAPVAVVSPPASLSSLLTVVYGAVVLGERLSAWRWALVVLAGVGAGVVGAG